MREQVERSSAYDLSKQSQEAVLRRLDNERKYLSSQLATEISHKNDLQNALTQV